MSVFDHQRDLWAVPFELTSSNNQIVIEEDSGADTISVDPGWYYNLHLSSADLPPSHAGFLRDLEAALNDFNNNLNGNYSITQHSPSDTDLTAETIKIECDEGFKPRFNAGTWNLDNRLLGAAPSAKEPPTLETTWYSAFSLLYQWRSQNAARGRARRKRKYTQKRLVAASDDPRKQRAQLLNEADRRHFHYRRVPGACVMEKRGHDRNASRVAGLYHAWRSKGTDEENAAGAQHGDAHNAFETIWRVMGEPGQDNKPNRALVFHNDGDLLQHGNVVGALQHREVVRWVDGDATDAWSEPRSRTGEAAEFYDLKCDVQILDTNYGQ